MKKPVLIAFLVLISISWLHAQWNGTPSIVSNPVSTAPSIDQNIYSVTDGSGGAIMVWTGNNNNGTYSVCTQRKTNPGPVSWSTAATPIVLFTGNRYLEVNDLVADGAGGAYISWTNELTDTTADLYLQRINGNGGLLFTAGGIKINPATTHYYSNAKICADPGGVIITWSDFVYNSINDSIGYAQVFAQRYNLAGTPQWSAGGVQVSTAAGIRALSEIVSDGSNGAFIAFSDARNSTMDANGNLNNADIFAQHLNSSGNRLWGASDAAIATEPYNQFTLINYPYNHYMIADSAGGIILVYEDYRNNNDTNANLYVQRLNSSGTRIWATAGVAVSNPSLIDKNCTGIAYDGANGAVTTWEEYTTVNGGALFAQRIVSGGSVAWGVNGKLVTPSPNQDYINGTMAPDGAGNYVFNWSTFDFTNNLNVIRGQKLNGSGNFQWAAAGVNICTNVTASPRNPKIIRSSDNSMLVGWEDNRNGNSDIYAARIDPAGSLISSGIIYTTSKANGNWNNAATWSTNAVPAANADVLIQHNVVGNVNTTCNSIRIITPGILTVNTGIKITILK